MSLVADDGAIIGHVALSPVTIDSVDSGWFGLGPVSVLPDRQRRGTGTALITRGLDRLRGQGAAGCVVLGSPGYYRRFGFSQDATLRYELAPPGYFMAMRFAGEPPSGAVAYHSAFAGI